MKVAVVTGAGTGIGRATAVALDSAGWSVACLGRRRTLLDETVSELTNGLAITCDIAVPEEVDQCFAQIVERFGRIDLLFNNAGRGAAAAPIDEIPLEDWFGILNANLTGAFLCARAAFGQMRRQNPRGGRIINNGSISAHVPRPGTAPYTVTKHAMTGLTRTVSLDGRIFDIACGQIDIGNAGTEMAMPFADGVPQADGSIRAEPLMDVDHVADAVVHMAELPLQSNVQFMTIMATKMPFIGRG